MLGARAVSGRFWDLAEPSVELAIEFGPLLGVILAGVAGFKGVEAEIEEAPLETSVGAWSLNKFEVAIADTSLPGLAGLETFLDALRGLRERGPFGEFVGHGVDVPHGGEEFAYASETGAVILGGGETAGLLHLVRLKGQRECRWFVGVGALGIEKSGGGGDDPIVLNTL